MWLLPQYEKKQEMLAGVARTETQVIVSVSW